jgi:outer membrane receptor for ferrienterochelin and colicins
MPAGPVKDVTEGSAADAHGSGKSAMSTYASAEGIGAAPSEETAPCGVPGPNRLVAAALFLFHAAGAVLLVVCLLGVDPASGSPDKDLLSMSLEQLMSVDVYGASRFGQTSTDAPSSVSIVTSDEIKKYGYRTLADILRSLRGFYVSYDRNYSYMGVRGFGRNGGYNNRVLFLIDGHRLNDNLYDSVGLDGEFIVDVDLFDRVEVIRGPSSSLYGSNAFFAVINIITKKGKQLGGGEASAAGGSYDSYKGRVTWGKEFKNGLQTIVSGSGLHSLGGDLYYREFDTPATGNGIARNRDGERNFNLFTTTSFRDFTLQAAYASRTKDVPTGSYGTDFKDPRMSTTDTTRYVDLAYGHTFGNDVGLSARTSYNEYSYSGDSPYSGVLNKDSSEGRWWLTDVAATKTFFDRHKVTGGGEYQDNLRQYQENHDESPYGVYLDDSRRSHRWAAFVQDEYSIMPNLILNAGVRYDSYSTFGSTTNPRTALIYKPFDGTAFKLMYGTAFRAPNVYELYYRGIGMAANPDLRPERIATYEAVWEQVFSDYIRTTADFFYYRAKNLITQVVNPAGDLVFQNVNEPVTARGAEFEIEGRWPKGITGRLSYTFTDTMDYGSRERPVDSPRHMVKLNFSAPLVRDILFPAIEMQYMSSRKTFHEANAGGYVVANFTLSSQKLLKDVDLSASIYNIFDRKYGDPGGAEHTQPVIGQDGRTFRVKATYRF